QHLGAPVPQLARARGSGDPPARRGQARHDRRLSRATQGPDRSDLRLAPHGQAAGRPRSGPAVSDPRRLPRALVTELDRTADRRIAEHVVDGGRLRALILELWQRTRMDWGFVTDRLSTAFRKETWLGSHDRRFVGEAIYGMVRHLRRIDTAIARGRKTTKPPK